MENGSTDLEIMSNMDKIRTTHNKFITNCLDNKNKSTVNKQNKEHSTHIVAQIQGMDKQHLI